MQSNSTTAALCMGRIMSALVVLILLADAATSLFAPGSLADEMAATGWTLPRATVIGLITLTCGIRYAIPRTWNLNASRKVAF